MKTNERNEKINYKSTKTNFILYKNSYTAKTQILFILAKGIKLCFIFGVSNFFKLAEFQSRILCIETTDVFSSLVI